MPPEEEAGPPRHTGRGKGILGAGLPRPPHVTQQPRSLLQDGDYQVLQARGQQGRLLCWVPPQLEISDKAQSRATLGPLSFAQATQSTVTSRADSLTVTPEAGECGSDYTVLSADPAPNSFMLRTGSSSPLCLSLHSDSSLQTK